MKWSDSDGYATRPEACAAFASLFARENICVRPFNSSSRFRKSSPHVRRAIQRSQSGLWILRRDIT